MLQEDLGICIWCNIKVTSATSLVRISTICIFIPADGCVGRGSSGLLFPGAYNAVKMALPSTQRGIACVINSELMDTKQSNKYVRFTERCCIGIDKANGRITLFPYYGEINERINSRCWWSLMATNEAKDKMHHSSDMATPRYELKWLRSVIDGATRWTTEPSLNHQQKFSRRIHYLKLHMFRFVTLSDKSL